MNSKFQNLQVSSFIRLLIINVICFIYQLLKLNKSMKSENFSFSFISKWLIIILSISKTLTSSDDYFEYNFINYQNYAIDLAFKHLVGTNLYFYPKDKNNSLFVVSVDPDLTLGISMKLYTNDTELINVINSEGSLYFGIDFNINNTDITLPDLRSDVVVCCFNKVSGNCYDFAFNISSNTYIYNENAKVLMNNLIPIGVNNSDVDVLFKNVIDYQAYYAVSLEKYYYVGFDNATMFDWLNFKAGDLNATVNAFYGEGGSQNCNVIKTGFNINDTYYYGSEIFVDGEGLNLSAGQTFKRSFYTIFYLILIYLF